MVTYNPYKNLYKVFGKTLTEKRAKRDGRNPATGAFSTNSHTGAVDLTVDIPMVKGMRNVALPDKTKYTKHDNSPDFSRQDFDDKCTAVFTYDSENPADSTCVVSDAYGNDVNLVYTGHTSEQVGFSVGDAVMVFVLEYPDSVNFAKDGKTYINANLRRNNNGMLFGNGYDVESKILYSDIKLDKIFTELN